MKRRFRYFFLIVAACLLSGGLSYWQVLLQLDWFVYDQISSSRQPSFPSDLIIVDIDESSIQALGRWPWPRRYHAQLLDELNQANAKAVILDILLTDRGQDGSQDDALLASAIERSSRVALPLVVEAIRNQGQLIERLPLAEFSNASGILGHVHVERDEDGVCRSVFLKEGVNTPYWPHISVSLLSKLLDRPVDLPGIHRDDVIANSGTMKVARDYFNLIHFLGAGGTVPHISYVDILEHKIKPDFLENKIVFVGMTAAGMGDSFMTPVGEMSGVELNANIFESLRQNKFLTPVEEVYRVSISTFLTLILVVALSMLSPKWILWGFLGITSAVLGASYCLIIWGGVWFPPVSIIAAVLVFYPLWNWQRLELALSFMKAELDAIEIPVSQFDEEQGLDRHIQSLRFLKKLYPIETWRIEPLTGAGQAFSENLKNSPPTTELHFYRKNIHVGAEKYLIEISAKEKFEGELLTLLDRRLFSKGEASRRASNHSVEIVEKTLHELSRARKSLAHSQELAKESIQSLPEAMFVTDNFGCFQYVNQCARKEFNIPIESDLDILDIIQGITTDDSIDKQQVLRDLCVQGKSFVFEGGRLEDGKVYVCRGQKILLEVQKSGEQGRAGEHSVLVFYFNDITTLKENERTRLDTLHFLSHDLRSPMTSVLALIETAKLDRNQNMTGVLDKIESYVGLSLNYAQQFIQLAKAENSDKDDFYICDLQDIVDNAVDQIFPTAKNKNITVTACPLTDSLTVLGDGDLLERMFNNLLNNAVKFSNVGGVIEVVLNKDENNSVQVAVIDQGAGISAEELPYLFERFKKGKSENPTGTGLGLYFVSVVCERHGGSATAENNVKGGATFTVSMPCMV